MYASETKHPAPYTQFTTKNNFTVIYSLHEKINYINSLGLLAICNKFSLLPPLQTKCVALVALTNTMWSRVHLLNGQYKVIIIKLIF